MIVSPVTGVAGFQMDVSHGIDNSNCRLNAQKETGVHSKMKIHTDMLGSQFVDGTANSGF